MTRIPKTDLVSLPKRVLPRDSDRGGKQHSERFSCELRRQRAVAGRCPEFPVVEGAQTRQKQTRHHLHERRHGRLPEKRRLDHRPREKIPTRQGLCGPTGGTPGRPCGSGGPRDAPPPPSFLQGRRGQQEAAPSQKARPHSRHTIDLSRCRRPSSLSRHIQEATIPGYRGELARALHGVVGTLSRGQVPGSIVSWNTSAWLTALKQPDGKHAPSLSERPFVPSRPSLCWPQQPRK